MRRSSIRKPLIYASAVLALASTATTRAADAVIPAGVSDEELFGTVIWAAKWADPNIAVCWENPEATTPEMLALTRQAVKDTWEAASKVQFIGWAKCAGSEVGIHVRIADELPRTRAVGNPLNKMPSGMVLNFSFANWETAKCKNDPNFCIRLIAVHEFGHALGFTHEQKKANVNAECAGEPEDFVGDFKVSDYDMNSVMALCNKHWMGDGKLSALDVKSIQRFYGA